MEEKDENKKDRKAKLLVFAVILLAALGFVLNFDGDKLNNNLHYHKKYNEAVDDMMSGYFDTADVKYSIVFKEFGDYKNTEYFRVFVVHVIIIKTINSLSRKMSFLTTCLTMD